MLPIFLYLFSMTLHGYVMPMYLQVMTEHRQLIVYLG